MPLINQYTFQTAAVATGAGTVMPCEGIAIVLVEITGITTATVTFQATGASGTYASVQAKPLATGTLATTATADGLYRVVLNGALGFRCNITSWTSGTITITGAPSNNPAF